MSPTRRPAGPPALRPPRRDETPPEPSDAEQPRELAAPELAPTEASEASATQVDPRIVARMIAVRRDAGRRRLRRLLVGVGVAAAVASLGLLTRTPLLDLDHLRVEGGGPDVDAAVRDAAAQAGARAGRALLDIEPGAIERAVEAVPAVADAHVSRRWPGTLLVQVSERIPVAAVGGALVAEDGVVIAIGAPPSDVPLVGLDGVAAPGAAGERVDAPDLLTVAAALPEEVRAAVAAVRAGPADGEVDLRLAGGGIARLGPTTALGSKLVAVATVLEQVDLACLATIDARVPSAPAVTRQPGCS